MSSPIVKLCIVLLGTAGLLFSGIQPSRAQQGTDINSLLEELLKQLPGGTEAARDAVSEEVSAGEQEAVAPVILSRDIAADDDVVVPAKSLPPIAGPEADLARRLLALTDSVENQEDVRREIAADFVRRLREPVLERPVEDLGPTSSEVFLAREGTGIPDGEELIFEVRMDNRRFLQSLFGIKRGEGVFIDLAEASGLLEFAIDVDPGAGQAVGFFAHPDNTFQLDLDLGQVLIEGEPVAVSPDDILRLDDAIFVHSDLFNVWFNVRLDLDFRDLIVNVVPQSPLPLQQRLIRQDRIAGLRRGARAPPLLPRLEDPYRIVAAPLADIRLQSTLLDTPGQPLRTTQTYSVVGRGDLAFATSEFFVAGNKGDIFNLARLTLRREDPTGGLLGPLQATRIEAGDTAPPGLPVGGTGIGAFVTNNTTGVQNLGTTTDFSGNQQPGTDVELYRNEILQSLQTVGEDGRYEFRNVGLLLGENRFRLVFYGTFGEIREERVTRNVTSVGRISILPTYSVAVFKPGASLIPLNSSSPEPGPLAIAFTAQRAFVNGIQASTGLSFLDALDPSTGNLNVGVRSAFLGGSANLQSATSFDKGLSASGNYRAKIRNTSFGLSYSTTQLSSPLNSNSFRADLSGKIPVIGSLTLPYSFFVDRNVQEDGLVRDSAEIRNSSGLGRYRISHSLNWTRADLPTANEVRSLTGNLQNTLLLSPFNIRLGVDYGLIETREINQLDGEVNWMINNRSQARFGYRRFLLSKRETFSLGGSYRFDRFIVSPIVTYDSNNQLFGLLSVSFSAAREPVNGKIVTSGSTFSGGGAVAARVYLDENLNRQFDPGEKLLEDVQVEAVHSNKSDDTNADGVAVIQRLTPYLLTDVRVRLSSLPDPFLAPLDPGRSVLPRPGRTNVIDFPIALTTEIDGTVDALRTEGGELMPLPGVTVELRDEQGKVVASDQTLFDGFFLFVNVFPGAYTIWLAPEDVTSQGFALPPPRRLRIPVSSDPILGVQIIVGRPGLALPVPADVKVAALRLGTLPTLESAQASQALFRELYPHLLGDLEIETPLGEQTAPYDLVLGRVSQGAADNICGRLKASKVACEIVTFPYIAEAPLALPTPTEAAGGSLPRLPALSAPSNELYAGPDMVDLGRYSTASRADVAWSLLRRLYAVDLDGAVRQNVDDNQTLVVGPLPHGEGEALCATLGNSVPRCELQPISTNTPVAVISQAPSPPLRSLRPVGLIVSSELVPVVETESLRTTNEIAEADETAPSETEETVVAVRLGEYDSQTGVHVGWQLMRRLYPEVLRRAQPLESADPASERRPLLVGPFNEIDALTVCARLNTDGQSCRVTRARL